MKKFYGLLVLLALALLVGVGVTTSAQATAFYAASEDGTVTIEKSKTVDGSAFMGAHGLL